MSEEIRGGCGSFGFGNEWIWIIIVIIFLICFCGGFGPHYGNIYK